MGGPDMAVPTLQKITTYIRLAEEIEEEEKELKDADADEDLEDNE
eukprot:CAMPEP_0202457852 /NCGR_PEP_ID=MMETSP1360-20130828/15709_1 /ASSEMBLY_ACC=CAM_ASM_000848 /TAXON_ID=515479 /ORGANISM="Licmophora paradoxa, Strain CCMP2313" /LENGTH=44 /DNA_ID= /DNA_START= /DNA_END= /DNA_ORIENTATION=